MLGPPEPVNREALRMLVLMAADRERERGPIAVADAVMALIEPTLAGLEESIYSAWEASMGDDL